MFENITHEGLQSYWYIIISLLGALLVFLMFVQGGQTLINTIGKTSEERTMLINSIGRKWDLTFTTLVTFGGAFFASFPLFYSTSFGGAYWVWILILFSFVIQAVSYEFRTKANNFLGTKTYDTFLLLNGVLATILIGAAVGTFFTGSEFSVEKMRLTNASDPVISRWENGFHGLEAALNIVNLSLGLTLFFLTRILALLYFMNSVNDEAIKERSVKHIKINTIPFLVTFLLFVVLVLTKKGFAVDEAGVVSMEDFKYLHNLLQMPIVLILFLIGVVGVLYGIFMNAFKNSDKGIWFAGIGTIAVVLSVFFLAGFNNTAYYPSTFDLQSSLTIRNSSSSKYTLVAMSWVSLFIPVVLAYIWYAWKSINIKAIDKSEMETTEHKY
ncbi:MAG: cytochrome d ubiquinol oxidase subunit II [Bacteroidales bacterium]|nr:cytochrome d ubiquinol oxidase subunit II [Bacteroidales bacterium]